MIYDFSSREEEQSFELRDNSATDDSAAEN